MSNLRNIWHTCNNQCVSYQYLVISCRSQLFCDSDSSRGTLARRWRQLSADFWRKCHSSPQKQIFSRRVNRREGSGVLVHTRWWCSIHLSQVRCKHSLRVLNVVKKWLRWPLCWFLLRNCPTYSRCWPCSYAFVPWSCSSQGKILIFFQ